MTTISPHTTRANGTILTATIYNTDHSNHISNAQALNADKVEGATPPVVDGNAVVFDGTSGAAIRDSGSAPVLEDDLPLAIALGGTGKDTAEEAFDALKQAASETATGVVELATTAEVRARGAADDRVLTVRKMRDALASASLSDAATIAVDWQAGFVYEVTVTASRIIGNPTNGIPGSTAYIYVAGNSATPRAITFGNQFLGEVPTITDVTDTKHYLIAIFCRSSTHFVASAKRALG